MVSALLLATTLFHYECNTDQGGFLRINPSDTPPVCQVSQGARTCQVRYVVNYGWNNDDDVWTYYTGTETTTTDFDRGLIKHITLAGERPNQHIELTTVGDSVHPELKGFYMFGSIKANADCTPTRPRVYTTP